MEYLCHKWPRICSTCRKHFQVLSSFMTYHGSVTRLTRQVSLVKQELLTLPEHLSSPPVFNGVRVTQSLVLYVCFVDRYLSFCTFSFGHCVVCSFSKYRFWLPLWYLQTLLPKGFNMPTAVIQRVLVIFVIDECILILTIIFHSNSPLKIVWKSIVSSSDMFTTHAN